MKLEIKNLTFEAIIGIYKLERENPQKVVVDAVIDYEFSDNYFIDYAELVSFIKHMFDQKRFLLLEEAIIHLKSEILKKYEKINSITISITKPEALKSCMVTISG